MRNQSDECRIKEELYPHVIKLRTRSNGLVLNLMTLP